ncbi:hypothetical protein [Burkholderia vietnamiensis]|uniref:hypothetical protein n=1 Tax=Burkholderia vietnamiensis TaxID=60552 RepID=UPI0012D8A9E5|nr:hypothetical protein [Burkholderia vietnamiensis]
MAAAQPLPVFNTRDDYLASSRRLDCHAAAMRDRRSRAPERCLAIERSRDGHVRTIARRDTPAADEHPRFIRAYGRGADFSFVIRVFD